MKFSFKTITSLTILLCFSLMSKGQQIGEYCVVKTKDGNVYQGELIENNKENIIIKDQNIGQITLERSIIKSVKKSDNISIKNGVVNIHSSAASRYFFAPSSFGLEKNDAYYQNFMIFYNHFSYGVTDKFTVGATIIPTFLFGVETPIGLSAKYSTPIAENFHWSIGALGGTILGAEDFSEENGGVIGYTTLTIGNKRNNLTGGFGITNSGENLIVISGNIRLSKKFHFMTENYVVPDEIGVFSLFGARYLGRSVTFDFGLMRPFIPDEDFIIVGIPFVGVTFPLSFGSSSELSPQKKTRKTVKR